jgi:hypothetical protein
MTLQKLSSRLNGKTELTFTEALQIRDAVGVVMPLEVLFERAE